MNSKINFATRLYNLRMKGQKITKLSKYVNDVIRDQGGINCRDDVINLKQKVMSKSKSVDLINKKIAMRRIQEIRENYFKFNNNFENRMAEIDREIEMVLLYYTPDVRKNIIDMDAILKKVEQNEFILR